MKKTFILFLLCSVLTNAHAQFTNVWTKPADGTGYSWFSATANANNVASLAYNPATNKLLVSSRNNNIYIINATTGASEGTLSIVGLGTESFKFNKIRVDADGVIYGISLAALAAGATGNCRIYRWADQASAPTLCANFAVTERCGDAFGLSGTGANTVLYASGAGLNATPANIYILNTTDGTNFALESKVTVASSPTANQQWANRTVEPDGTGVNADIWIKGGGFEARKISVSAPSSGVRTGTVVTTIVNGTTGGQASIGYGGMRVMTVSGTKYLLFSGGNNAEAGTVLRSLNITNEAAPTLYGTLSYAAAYTANNNGSGDVSYKVNGDGTFQVFYLSTNNALGMTSSVAIPVELIKFTGKLKNQQTLLNWSTASEINNAGFSVERSMNGLDYAAIGFVKPQPSGNGINNYDFTDATVQNGQPITYYRLKQMDTDGKFDYSPVVAIKRSNEKLSLSAVYPMPITEGVTLEVVSKQTGKVTVSVTDIVGRLVKTENFTVSEGSNALQLGLNQLAKGTYILNLNNGEVNINQRIVKQ
jgi:Secretion system C-terminal sorting domain